MKHRMTDQASHVLLFCAGHSARSIQAEILLEGLDMGRFRASYADNYPAGSVSPSASRSSRRCQRQGGDHMSLKATLDGIGKAV